MDTPIEIEKSHVGDIHVYEFIGELDETNVDQAFETIYTDLGGLTGKKVVFHLTKLAYMNSKSIGYFADIFSKLTDAGGKLMLAEPTEDIFDTLEIVGITNIIPICKTLKEATDKIG